MDFLSQTLAQLKSRLQSTPPGTRVAAGLLLIAVAVGAGYLLTFRASGDEVYLFEDARILPEDLPKMRTAFAQKKLNSYTIDGNRIRVPRKQLDLYVSALDEANALPGRPGTCLDELLGKSSFFEGSQMTELRMLNAKQKELVRILCTWDFIADAAVIIDTESQGRFRRDKIITASVSIVPAGSKRLAAGQVASIREFMTGAVAGLKSQNVKISDSSGSLDRNDHGALTKIYEREWKAKILGALSYVPGAVVTTNVVLDRQDRPKTSDRPPVAADYHTNGANVSQSLRPASRRFQQKSERSPATGIPSAETAAMPTAGCTPARISVSVAVPSSYFAKVWQKRNPAANGRNPRVPDPADLEKIRMEETAKIRLQVAALLPPVEGLSDPTRLVNVSTFPDLPPGKAAESSGDKGLAARIGRHRALLLGVLGAALLGLLAARSVIRAKCATREEDPPNIPSIETGDDEEIAAADPSTTDPSGIDLEERPGENPPPPSNGAAPFRFLEETEDDRLAGVLLGERPQAIAMILAHLSPDQAGRVLGQLDPAIQAEVIHRLVDLERTDPQILRDVEETLQARLSQYPGVRPQRSVGMKAAAGILDAAHGGLGEEIRDNLAAHDQVLAEELGGTAIRFDDLSRFNDESLTAVCQSVEPEVLTTALVGAPPDLVDRIVRRLPSREGKRVRRQIEHPGPIRLSDMEEARRRIVGQARRLTAEGRVTLPADGYSPVCDFL